MSSCFTIYSVSMLNISNTLEGSFAALPLFPFLFTLTSKRETGKVIKCNNDGCFQLKQRIHSNLFEAFKLIFDTSRKIGTTDNYNQFGVSSKSDIQKVINFFSFSGLHPLIGLKYIQYIQWLNNLRESSRYSKLNYPQK